MSFVILTADVVDVDDVGVVVDVVGNVVVGGVGVEDVGVGLVAPDQSAILEETLAWWCSVLTKWPDWWEVAVLPLLSSGQSCVTSQDIFSAENRDNN